MILNHCAVRAPFLNPCTRRPFMFHFMSLSCCPFYFPVSPMPPELHPKGKSVASCLHCNSFYNRISILIIHTTACFGLQLLVRLDACHLEEHICGHGIHGEEHWRSLNRLLGARHGICMTDMTCICLLLYSPLHDFAQTAYMLLLPCKPSMAPFLEAPHAKTSLRIVRVDSVAYRFCREGWELLSPHRAAMSHHPHHSKHAKTKNPGNSVALDPMRLLTSSNGRHCKFLGGAQHSRKTDLIWI